MQGHTGNHVEGVCQDDGMGLGAMGMRQRLPLEQSLHQQQQQQQGQRPQHSQGQQQLLQPGNNSGVFSAFPYGGPEAPGSGGPGASNLHPNFGNFHGSMGFTGNQANMGSGINDMEQAAKRQRFTPNDDAYAQEVHARMANLSNHGSTQQHRAKPADNNLGGYNWPGNQQPALRQSVGGVVPGRASTGSNPMMPSMAGQATSAPGNFVAQNNALQQLLSMTQQQQPKMQQQLNMQQQPNMPQQQLSMPQQQINMQQQPSMQQQQINMQQHQINIQQQPNMQQQQQQQQPQNNMQQQQPNMLQQFQQQLKQQQQHGHPPQQLSQQQQLQQQLMQQIQAHTLRNSQARLDGLNPRPPMNHNSMLQAGLSGIGRGMVAGYGTPGMMGNMMQQQQHPALSNPAVFQQLLLQRQQQQQLQAQLAAQQAAPEPEEDKEEDILAKVGKISDKLRSMLGTSVTDKGFGGTDEDGAASNTTIVKRENLIEACGPIASSLKSYQLVGINFLMMLHKSESVGGAILADEMGLGKTAQTITFLGVLRTLLGNRSPHLVVCPASLIQNWAREFKQWCPSLRVLIYHGKERDQAREALQRWRKKVRTAHKEGRIEQLPPGILFVEDEEAREDARAEAAERQHLEDLEDPPDYGEDEGAGEHPYLAQDWDDSRPVGGLVLPAETSGEAAFDVMLTTYTLFEREGGYKADRAFLLKWKWGYMVADEAHALKNRSSIRTRKLRKVATSCESRILLTGTPLQNSLEELRALLEFLMPSLFIDPNNPEQDDTKDDELHMRKLAEEEQIARVERYKALLAPFILRRLKSEVATQLMSKKHVVEEVDMTPEQGKLYKAAVESMRREVAAASTIAVAKTRGRPRKNAAQAVAGPAGTPEAAAGNVQLLVARLGSQRVNNIFTHLRKVAQHPLLVRNMYTDEQIQEMAELASTHGLYGGNCTYDRVLKELSSYSDHQLHTFSSSWPGLLGQYMLDASALMASAKVRILDQLMPKFFAGGSKVLLFSQWTMTLDLLEWYMQLKGFSYVRLDGSTQVEERLSLVDKFNDPDQGIFCFLLSTRAGGQGLNLTGADIVVLHDVDFNPQVDRQAEDRCHRLGQTKPVTVYRLVTKGTVDQNVLAIAERKLALDAAVLNDVTVGGGGEDEDGEDGAAAAPSGPKRGRPGLDQREVRHMGAILSALLSDA